MKNLILISTIAFLTTDVMAQQSPVLHDDNAARGAYEDFKSGNNDDPLEIIRQGYRQSYSNDLQNSLSEQSSDRAREILDEGSIRLNSELTQFRLERDTSIESSYESNMTEEGLSTENFLAESERLTAEYQNRINDTIRTSRSDLTNQIISETESLIGQAGGSYTNNAKQATNNIIALINTETATKSLETRDRLNAAMESAEERIPIGNEAFELAQIFDGECEDCSITPPEVTPEPEPACRYDNNNKIRIFWEEENDYGNDLTTNYEESFYSNGVLVYHYQIRESRGRVSEHESGSKDGFTAGSQTVSDGGGSAGYSSSEEEYEICSN